MPKDNDKYEKDNINNLIRSGRIVLRKNKTHKSLLHN